MKAYPRSDKDELFEVITDFSRTTLVTIVSQKLNDEETFIAATGRKTSKYERIKGKLAAVIFALRKFEHLLRFQKCRLITDSSALR